jgi:FkbM family methyltransferase
VFNHLSELLRRLRNRITLYRWRLARAVGNTVTVNTRQGRLTVSTRDDVIGRLLYFEGQYQYELVQRTLKFLRDRELLPPKGQGTVLDVGANNGVTSIGMLRDGEFATAVGLEPDPANFGLLTRNVRQNMLDARYTALQFAATDKSGSLSLELSGYNWGDHRIRTERTGMSSEMRSTVNVEGKRLDEIVPAIGTPDLVWVDVQGHEGRVFVGGSALFSSGVPVVSEVWPYGILRSGMTILEFCGIAGLYWSTFWVWRRCGRYIAYPIGDLPKFCEELGDGEGAGEDVIFTASPGNTPTGRHDSSSSAIASDGL